MQISELPPDVLRNILLQCKPGPITETCRIFASLIHSTPSLWSTIKLGPSQFIPEGSGFIRSRLQRAETRPIKVTIGPVCNSADKSIISALCTTISEFNTQIIKLDILAQSSLWAGTMFGEIFPDVSGVFPELQSLTVIAAWGNQDPHTPALPYLDKHLGNMDERFPALRQLFIPTLFDCIPMPPNASFNFIRSLVLHGIFQMESANLVCVISLLHSTPQLEALWFKNATRDDDIKIHTGPEEPLVETKGRRDIQAPVFLPCLTHIAVTSPGCATELLRYIVAPALQNIHLDGSRPITFGLCCNPWESYQAKSVRSVLRVFCNNSPNLRHIALTSAFLEQEGLEWLLFGESTSDPPPFPQLETLALHQLEVANGECLCGFDNQLLLRLARELKLPLRRLVLSACHIGLDPHILFAALKAAAADKPSFELVIADRRKPLTEDQKEELAIAGITVIQRKSSVVSWHNENSTFDDVDPFDSSVY